MKSPFILKAFLFSLSFIPFWFAYTILLYTANRLRPEYQSTTFLDWVEYSSIIVGVSTLLGVVNLYRVLSFKRDSKRSIQRFLLIETFAMFLFVVSWLVITELIFLNFYHSEETRNVGLWGQILFIIENTGKIYSGLFLYVSYTGISYAYFFYSEQRLALKRERLAKELAKEMKMEAMMNYMQPHFFFNCISAISELIHRDPIKADDALIKLSGILRYLIDKDKQFHSIESEMILTHNYVELQKIRHGDKFIYSENIDVTNLHEQIPILTIQILVENSFNHASKSNHSAIEVHVAIIKKDKTLNVYVCDSGSLEHTDECPKGRGLDLLVQRMNAAYKKISFNHGFTKKTLLNKSGYQTHIEILP